MPSGIIVDHQYQAGTTYKTAIEDSIVSLGSATHLAKIQPTTGDFAGKSATAVWIHCLDNPIYFTPGGTDPDTAGAIGHPLDVGGMLELKNWDNIKNAKFIRQGSSSGNIMWTPFFNMA